MKLLHLARYIWYIFPNLNWRHKPAGQRDIYDKYFMNSRLDGSNECERLILITHSHWPSYQEGKLHHRGIILHAHASKSGPAQRTSKRTILIIVIVILRTIPPIRFFLLASPVPTLTVPPRSVLVLALRTRPPLRRLPAAVVGVVLLRSSHVTDRPCIIARGVGVPVACGRGVLVLIGHLCLHGRHRGRLRLVHAGGSGRSILVSVSVSTRRVLSGIHRVSRRVRRWALVLVLGSGACLRAGENPLLCTYRQALVTPPHGADNYGGGPGRLSGLSDRGKVGARTIRCCSVLPRNRRAFRVVKRLGPLRSGSRRG